MWCAKLKIAVTLCIVLWQKCTKFRPGSSLFILTTTFCQSLKASILMLDCVGPRAWMWGWRISAALAIWTPCCRSWIQWDLLETLSWNANPKLHSSNNLKNSSPLCFFLREWTMLPKICSLNSTRQSTQESNRTQLNSWTSCLIKSN